MLKQRIIAKILIDEAGTAVKFKQFTHSRRVVGDPVSTVRVLEDQRVDEFYLCFLGEVDLDLVNRITDNVLTPVTVAGSIRDIDTIDKLIRDCGVEKVVIKDDEIGWKVSRKFGRQACVWPLDYRGDAGFNQVPLWAGEMIITSIDRDGMMRGPEIEALRFPWPCPVVISGGVGKLSHVKDAFDAGADGVAVASMFAFTDKSPIKLRSWMLSEGCNIRPDPGPWVPPPLTPDELAIISDLSESQINDIKNMVGDDF